MLIKLTREKSGNILFDENLVCQIEFLRVVFDKYGKSAVAYVIWYADIDSIFNDLPDQLKEEQIGTSCGLDKKVIKSKEIEYAIFEYDKFCKSKASGVVVYDFFLNLEEAFFNKMKYWQTFNFEYKCSDKLCKVNSSSKTETSSIFGFRQVFKI